MDKGHYLKPGMIERFREAVPILKKLVDDLEWIESEFVPSEATEEERSLVKHLQGLGGNPFDETAWRLERMFAPDIIAQGRLFKNSSGRFEIEGTDIYFTCGSGCEIYVPYYYDDDEGENMTWVPTSIEAQNGEYYFTARPDFPMMGALVRIRGKK
jgi:hypothetical protein